MIEVEFDIQIVGEAANDEPLLDDYELSMMLDHTRSQINRHVQHSLSSLRCAEHDQSAKVRITGEYSMETEQLDFAYQLDTCCQLFLMQAITALNRK